MPASPAYQPAGTNFLGQAVTDSRQRFRMLVQTLDELVAGKRLEEARTHLAKLEAMKTELHRMLNPRDPVDQKTLAQIDRDVVRLRKAVAKGWGGAVGKGLLAAVFGTVIGVALLLWLMWKFI